ncbi:hypothetical protein ACWGLF_41215 [Streptomyces puniciscabiei]
MPADLTRLSATASVTDVTTALEPDRGVIVEDLADEATLKGLRDDLGPSLVAAGYENSSFTGQRTKQIGSLFAPLRHMQQIALDPLYLGTGH